jgi:hypothetical protein
MVGCAYRRSAPFLGDFLEHRLRKTRMPRHRENDFACVIAGLDPAIHAEGRPGQASPHVSVCRTSAWTTGSSPVVTRQEMRREKDEVRPVPRHPEVRAKRASKDERPRRRPKSLLPISEFFSVQVGNSRLGCCRPSRLGASRRAPQGDDQPHATGRGAASSSRAARRSFRVVIAGLDPAIHAEPHLSMDHRVKPGGDEARDATRERICFRPPDPSIVMREGRVWFPGPPSRAPGATPDVARRSEI